MFVDFFYQLRAAGLRPTTTEFLALMEALVRGEGQSSLSRFYTLGRALLVKREADYDTYDRVFAATFGGAHEVALDDELWRWLERPVLPRPLTDAERAQLAAWDLDRLREELRRRLAEQKERHDGGSRWIGTGGTSPFGHGGHNPAGLRIGGGGGARSAVQVAGERRFRNLRADRVLGTRDIALALRRLRRLSRDAGPTELDVDATIDKSAREGGEIELVFAPPKKNVGSPGTELEFAL